ncbi:tripartite tricarboxylate transporter substrate binding protein [Nonomuraea sp. M3C6]|uniref:Tripartite tricarboxylate transporter substrate binding protein n=1 Tax=Nonomuraea marmarensis TaxID=3351344 RepID=A0ABW7AHX3_9ACTN
MRLFAVLSAACLAATACATGGPAASAGGGPAAYPDKGKSIRLLIPYGAGGGTDLAGRLLASGLEKDLGARVVVENDPSGSGQNAMRNLAAAKKDGYTLAFTPLPATNMMYLDKERGATFSGKDFEPIANHDTDPIAIGTSAKGPLKSLAQLVSEAKAAPGKITAGSNGVLAAGHLGLLQLEQLTGIKITWTSFDDGGQLRTSVLGGSVNLEVQPVSELTAAKANGDMRILAIMSDKRWPGLDDVPTVQESGFADSSLATNRVLVAPAGTSKAIIDKLSASIKKSIGQPDYQAQAKKRLLQLNYMDSAQVAALWTQFDTTFAPIAQQFRASS